MVTQTTNGARPVTDTGPDSPPSPMQAPASAAPAPAVPAQALASAPTQAQIRGFLTFDRVAVTMTIRLARLIWLAVAIVDAILVLDFVFRLIAARDTGFVHGIFVIGSAMASPFTGIFASVPPISHYTFTWSDLVPMLLVTVVGWIAVRLIRNTGLRTRWFG